MENIAPKPQIHEHPVIRLLAALFFLALPFLSVSQDRHVPSARAEKFFLHALEDFQKGDYATGRIWLEKATDEDSLYADAWILMGDVCSEMKDEQAAIDAYSTALSLNPDKPLVVRNLLANALFQSEHYGEAAVQYGQMLTDTAIRDDLRVMLVRKKEVAEFRQDLMDHPVTFQPKNLGGKVNSANEEYVNYLGPDGEQLIFTRKSPVTGDPMQRDFEEDFYQSLHSDTGWSDSERFSFSASTKGDAGGLCMSADGKMIFFTACFRRDSQGSCDLYYCEKTASGWSEPKNMGPVINSDNWDAQPALSPDSRTLYFASNREGSLGSSDIWKTERLPDGSWSKPVNIGPPVNTPDTEMGPFMHFDNETMYFSSKGHLGMAGQDLFVTRKSEDGWQQPLNLGYPINTSSDEINIVVTPAGDQAYISASLPGGFGGYDMYSFDLPEKIRPVPVTYLKGLVYDAETRKPLEAGFELIDLEKDSLVMHAVSSLPDGAFLVCLPTGRSYGLNVSCPGYLFYSDHFELTGTQALTDPFLRDVPLQPVKVGNTIVMKNIFFDTDQYALKEQSTPELEKLAEFLHNNPGVSVEISGHTDNVGTDTYNEGLSQHRADAVRDYLVSRSVQPGRLTSKGYGNACPVAPNDTEEGRALNRRTEIRVTGVKN